jgi:methyl-accepting chemotaxis protein
LLDHIDFPASDSTLADLRSALDRVTALNSESDAAIQRPKAERRAGLADDIVQADSALIAQVEKTSSQLVRMVKLQDAFIDQLLQLKELAWTMRNSGGQTALIVTQSFAKKPSPDSIQAYMAARTEAKSALATLEQFSEGLPLPADFKDAVEQTKAGYFSDDYGKRQLHVLKANLAGQDPGVKPAEWDPESLQKLNPIVTVAEKALTIAMEHSAALRSQAWRNLIVQLVMLAAALAVAVPMMLVISNRIIHPLERIREAMAKLADGDFNVALPRLKHDDEIGQIVGAVRSMVDRVRATISEIKTSAREVTNASSEIATSTTDLSQRTEEQAASLEETTASMEEISATVRKNAESAQQATQSASATREVADRGGEVAANAVKAMSRIEESSRKIVDIIGVIDEIARQTNLLALNAAVEAARAGEAGRGFAVVASEVRSLAQRSSQAAKDIKEIITNSSSQVGEGVELVNQAGAALNEIVASIRTVTDIVTSIATASAEQATGLEEINKALSQMDEATQRNSALVEENAATAKTLEQQAKSMDGQVAFFQVEARVVAHSAPEAADHARPRAAAKAAPSKRARTAA